MSGRDVRTICWCTALAIIVGSAVYLSIHWSGAVGPPPYGLASLVTIAVILLMYAGHQAGVEKPKLVYVETERQPKGWESAAPDKKAMAHAYVDAISSAEVGEPDTKRRQGRLFTRPAAWDDRPN